MAASSWCEDWTMRAALADRFAPEHLEIATADPEALLAKVRHAGAIFLGRHTPEAMGDYIAGPNHVLPTSRIGAFLVRPFGAGFHEAHHASWRWTRPPSPTLGPDAITLAEAEGLDAHARSIAARLNRRRLMWTTASAPSCSTKKAW